MCKKRQPTRCTISPVLEILPFLREKLNSNWHNQVRQLISSFVWERWGEYHLRCKWSHWPGRRDHVHLWVCEHLWVWARAASVSCAWLCVGLLLSCDRWAFLHVAQHPLSSLSLATLMEWACPQSNICFSSSRKGSEPNVTTWPSAVISVSKGDGTVGQPKTMSHAQPLPRKSASVTKMVWGICGLLDSGQLTHCKGSPFNSMYFTMCMYI